MPTNENISVKCSDDDMDIHVKSEANEDVSDSEMIVKTEIDESVSEDDSKVYNDIFAKTEAEEEIFDDDSKTEAENNEERDFNIGDFLYVDYEDKYEGAKPYYNDYNQKMWPCDLCNKAFGKRARMIRHRDQFLSIEFTAECKAMLKTLGGLITVVK